MASKLQVGQVAYSQKTGIVYTYLGKRVVNCSYTGERDLTVDQSQTVQVWFSNNRLSTRTYLLREPATLQQKVQDSVTNYATGYAGEEVFRVAVRPNLIPMDFRVEVDEYAIVEHYAPLYEVCKGYRSDGDKNRIKYYLCYGEWCRKHIIDRILIDLNS